MANIKRGAPQVWAPLPFEEAVTWFGNKSPALRAHADEMSQAQRRRAFWVSQVAQLEVVAQALKAVNKAVAEGTTLADFKKDAGTALESAWKGTVKNPGARLEVIFRNGAQSAYAAGRFKQATDPDELALRPMWMFDAVMDGRTSSICAAADGTILSADDPWWATRHPPCHHNCRSHVTTLSEDEAAALLGKKGYKSKGTEEKAQEGWGQFPDDGETIEAWGQQKTNSSGELAAEAAAKIDAAKAAAEAQAAAEALAEAEVKSAADKAEAEARAAAAAQSAADKAAAYKVAADKVAADKAKADKAAEDNAKADKAAADKVAEDKSAKVAKALEDAKAQAAADKAAADKAAAEAKSAAEAKAKAAAEAQAIVDAKAKAAAEAQAIADAKAIEDAKAKTVDKGKAALVKAKAKAKAAAKAAKTKLP